MKRKALLGCVFSSLVVFGGEALAAGCLGEAQPNDDLLQTIQNAAASAAPEQDASEVARQKKEAAERRLKVELIDRLLSIGDGGGALAFALHEKGLAVSSGRPDLVDRPAEALAALRAIRFVANGFDGAPPLGEAESNHAAWRLRCLNDGVALVGMLISHIEGELKKPANGQEAVAMEDASVEASLGLLAVFKIEAAELQRDIGDLYFRTISLDDLPQKGVSLADETAGVATGKAQMAMAHYREAQTALAAALGFAQERDVARIRLAAGDLQLRMGWLREGLAFGGRSYDIPTRPIGFNLQEDPLGFTILKSLSGRIETLEKAQTALAQEKSAALNALKEDFQTFAQTHAQAETHKHIQLQALFAELGRLEGVDIADLRVRHAQEEQSDATDASMLASLHQQEQAEIEGRRKAAVQALLADLPALTKQVAALTEFGPLLVPDAELSVSSPKFNDPHWKEDAALFTRVHGTCGVSLAPEARPALSQSWRSLEVAPRDAHWIAADLNKTPDVWLAAVREALGPEIAAEQETALQEHHQRLTGAMKMLEEVGKTNSQEAQMAERWQAAMRECWDLATQLQIERALLLNTKVALDVRRVEELAEVVAEQAKASSDALILQAEQAGADAAQVLNDGLYKLGSEVLDAATQQIEEKIAHTQKLLDDAQAIVDQVISTGKNFQGAVTAAKGVYSSLTTVPVGSGPGGVHFERSTLVAMTNSAVELARFTYRATNDILIIKRQLNDLESALKDYVNDLKKLSWARTEADIKEALERNQNDIRKAVADIANQSKSAILDNLDNARRRIEDDARALFDSAVLASDSKAGLIELQLEAVFAQLRRLAEEREALRAQQTYALQALLHELTRTIGQAQTARSIQAELAAAQNRQAKTLREIRERQENVLRALREKDASLAARVQEILTQIDKIRSGEAENAWSGARRLAASFLSPPPALNVEALASNLRVKRALEAAGDDLFELAVALRYLTEDEGVLAYAAQPSSLHEAERLRDQLVERYMAHIRHSLDLSPSVIALRITPEIARSWGRTPSGPNGELEYPRCLDPQALGGDPRCLRITTSFQKLRNWGDEASNLEARPSRHCKEAPQISEVLGDSGPQNNLEIYWPVNAVVRNDATGRPLVAADGSGYCPAAEPPAAELFEPPSVMGELVFHIDSMLQQGNRALLADAMVVTTSTAVGVQRPTNLIPVGATREVCRLEGDAFQERLIARPFTTRYQDAQKAKTNPGLKPSPNTLLPGDGGKKLSLALDRIDQKGPEEFFGRGVAGRRQLFYGRGMANTFEIQMPRSGTTSSQPGGVQHLSEEIYVFLIFLKVDCRGSGAESAEVAAGPLYKSDFDSLLSAEELREAPTARALLRFEHGLASADEATLSGRLALIEQSLDLAKALARPSNLNEAEEMGRMTARDFAQALPQTPPNERPQRMESLFKCALDGDYDCRLMLGGDGDRVAGFKSHPVDRPVPIRNFEDLIRLAMEDSARRDEPGPLPRELERKVEWLGETRPLLRQAVDFLDRSITTLRTLNILEDQAENRLLFLSDATEMLRVAAQPSPAGLGELLCADFVLSEPGFWLLQRNEGRLSHENELLGALRGFNASCRFDSLDVSGCQTLAKGINRNSPSEVAEAPSPVAMEDSERPDKPGVGEQCARKLGLSDEDAAAFDQAFSLAKGVLSPPAPASD
ncbi:coiled-coil domain-containing protein [Neomegalonema perideroedes]|uniref:hypothetical protein n=1 Tax=Neomegalonema perideroedes TaxID=217219 RepID=UPI000364347A|nr:hypothetical protein [Neomegalonema perideroedes]